MSQRNILWDEHLERLRRIFGGKPSVAPRPRTLGSAMSDGAADVARRREWSARPPGRLGRRLLADVEPYLDFFATTRPSTNPATTR